MMAQNGSNPEQPPYTVRLEMFEGPLDLLLHLIHKNELDISNIPIAVITDQYLEYLKLMKVLNLDVAGEYLLMASTLLHIKSRTLLPVSAEEKEEEEEDPRAELVKKLVEYQKYKDAAVELESRPMLGRDVFIRLIPQDAEKGEGEAKVEASLFQLLEAFREVLKRAKPEVFHEVTLERLSVEEKVNEILSILQGENHSLAFHLLFPEQAPLRVIIVTFLAVLELVKMKLVRIFQAAPFETIRISPIETRPPSSSSSERGVG